MNCGTLINTHEDQPSPTITQESDWIQEKKIQQINRHTIFRLSFPVAGCLIGKEVNTSASENEEKEETSRITSNGCWAATMDGLQSNDDEP